MDNKQRKLTILALTAFLIIGACHYIEIYGREDYSAGKYREETIEKTWEQMTEVERERWRSQGPGTILSRDPDARLLLVPIRVPVPEYRPAWRWTYPNPKGSMLPDVRMPWFVLGVTYAALFFLLKGGLSK